MTERSPTESTGFRMSVPRTLFELGLLVSAIVGGTLLVIYLAGRAAGFLTQYVPLDVDRSIGRAAWQSSIANNVCKSLAPERYIRRVAAPLLDALGTTPYEFRFVVVDDPEINAFALPGGYIVVNTGLLRAAESGDEVTAVLAHELMHVVLRHGTRKLLRTLGGKAVLHAIFGGTDVAVPAEIVSNLTHTAYDRNAESEADAGGLKLLSRAGVDPSAMGTFFRRLSRESATAPPFLSTHPDPGDRAELAEAAARTHIATLSVPAPGDFRCQ